MRKLLRAGFARIRKSKVFWCGMIVLAAFSLMFILNGYKLSCRREMPFPEVFAESIFQSTVLMGIVFAVFCSLFTGTEYDNGTIRNKLMVGQSRTSIYLSNFVCCMTAGMIQAVVSILVGLAAGFLLGGSPEMSVEHFLQVAVVALFVCTAYMSVYNLCSMLIASRSHASIVNILLAFSFLMFASYLLSRLGEPEMINNWSYTADGVLTAGDLVPNPNYIAGRKREIYQFLVDALPGGQSYLIANFGMHEDLLRHPALLCFYSAAVTVISNIAGILAFRRKDMK